MGPNARLVSALVAMVVALALPAAAQAASPSSILIDCQQDGKLDRKYSNGDLRRAKGQLSGDQAEYTDCLEVLEAAITTPPAPTASGSGGSGGGDGAPNAGAASRAPRAPADPATASTDLGALEEAKRKAAGRNAPGSVVRGPDTLRSVNAADTANAPPPPLLVVLAAAAMFGLGAGLYRSLTRSVKDGGGPSGSTP